MDDKDGKSLTSGVQEAYVKAFYAAKAGSPATPRYLSKLADLILALAESARAAKWEKADAERQ